MGLEPIIKKHASKKENHKAYNEYLMNLIPKDEDKNQTYVVLVYQKDADNPMHTKMPPYCVSEDISPIPLRYLRKGDAFVKLPLEDNPTIYFARSTPRDPKIIVSQNSSNASKLRFQVNCGVSENGYLVIPNLLTPVFSSDDTVIVSE